ncbi:MAG: hypothetical protein ACI8PZ_007170, partial [Myxococcota bacterium]
PIGALTGIGMGIPARRLRYGKQPHKSAPATG